MIFKCEYCLKELKTSSSLNYHKKTTKYCLEIQGKENNDFKCNKCKKTYTTKERLKNHSCKNIKDEINIEKKSTVDEEILSLKNKISELEKENSRLQNETLLFKYKINDLENENKDLKDRLERIASRPTNQINTTNNSNSNNTINVTLDGAHHLIDENLWKIEQKDYFIDGLKGMAEFIGKEVFPIESGLYVCSDKARNIFKFTNDKGDVVRDPNCFKLIEIAQPMFKEKLSTMYDKYDHDIKVYREKEKKSMISGKELLKFKKDKLQETKSEVSEMHKNNKFANHLSNILIN
jgi:hypothetical protein